jgi:dienelactone hydrolase
LLAFLCLFLSIGFRSNAGIEGKLTSNESDKKPVQKLNDSSTHTPRFISSPLQDFSAPGNYLTAYFLADIPGEGETMTASRIYYPIEGDTIPGEAYPCPIVIFGHGWMMGIDRYYSFGEHLASWGYITVLPTYSNPIFFPEHERRARCLVAAGRYVAALNEECGHVFYKKLDPDCWGFSGHSLGGALSMLVGALYSTTSLMDTLRVLVSMSGPDTSPSMDEERISLPKMLLGGTKDKIVPWEEMKTDIWDNSPAPGVFMVFRGANHNQFMDWSTPIEDLFDGTPEISRSLQLLLTRRHMTAYMERYMKGNKSHWNYQFCYGDSVRYGTHIDYWEIHRAVP